MFNLNLYFISNVKNIYKLIRQTDLSIITSNASADKQSYLIYPNHEDCEEIEKDKNKIKPLKILSQLEGLARQGAIVANPIRRSG